MLAETDFTKGPILSNLIKFTIPVLFALLLQSMYGCADLIIVGRFAETADVSGVATGSMLMHTITVLITGLAMGITIMVAQKIGEQKAEEAGKAVGNGICIFTILSAVLTVALTFGASFLSKLTMAPKEAFSQTCQYIMICGAGSFFICAYNVLGSIFRGMGDSKMPLITVAIACIINILGDLLLVAVFHMGAAGAALATTLSQAISVLLSVIIIRKRKLPFDFSLKDIHINKAVSSEIMQLGTPVAMQDFLVSVSFMALQSIVNTIGLTASAGVGVADKVCGLIMMVPSAFMQSMSAFVAQNIGAGEYERTNKSLYYSIIISAVVGIIMFYISFFHGDVISSFFAKSNDVIRASHEYLKAYAIDCMFTPFLFCFVGYFNGRGKTMFVMLQGVCAAFLIRIPIAYIFSRQLWATLFHIGLGTPFATLLQIIACIYAFCVVNRYSPKKKWSIKG